MRLRAHLFFYLTSRTLCRISHFLSCMSHFLSRILHFLSCILHFLPRISHFLSRIQNDIQNGSHGEKYITKACLELTYLSMFLSADIFYFIFFNRPTDPHLRDRATGNKTFLGDGLISQLLVIFLFAKPSQKKQKSVATIGGFSRLLLHLDMVVLYSSCSCSRLMHLSMLSPRVGGGGRHTPGICIQGCPLGRDFEHTWCPNYLTFREKVTL